MATKAHVLWDIDGVFNPLYSAIDPEDDYINVMDGWLNIWVRRHDGDFMREIYLTTEQVWCSSWEDLSNALAVAFHLPNSLPYITFTTRSSIEEGTWKLPDIVKWYEETKPEKFVWVDDEIQEDSYQWASSLAIPTLLIKPDPSYGLTEAMKKQIREFVYIR